MNAEQILRKISDYCRDAGLAESTFGRLAVNDGKLISRLRHGGRITTDTLERIRGYIESNPAAGKPGAAINGGDAASRAEPRSEERRVGKECRL